MGKLELYGVMLIIVALAMGAAYFKGHHAGAESVQVKWDKAIADQREREQQQAAFATTKLEAGNVQAKVVYRTITQTVDKVVEKPVYRSMCLDDDGLRVANQALAGSLAAPRQPDKPMPRSPAAPGRNSGLSVAEIGGGQ